MTPCELEELIEDCPTLYHMAEKGSWPSIQERGLMSTSALLDAYKVEGNQRVCIESMRRPSNITLTYHDLPPAVVRDQIPMDDAGLVRCLPAHLRPADWYRVLNHKVFFWLSRARLLRLLDAVAYRDKSHDVIELNTQSVIDAYKEKIWLCPINSGCTKPFPHPRDENTFSRISDYPYQHWRSRRRRGERVVELAVDYAVPDLKTYVTRVVEMRGIEEKNVIFEADA